MGRSGSDWVLSLEFERPGGSPWAPGAPAIAFLLAGPWSQEKVER